MQLMPKIISSYFHSNLTFLYHLSYLILAFQFKLVTFTQTKLECTIESTIIIHLNDSKVITNVALRGTKKAIVFAAG